MGLPATTAEMRADLVDKIHAEMSVALLDGMIVSSKRAGDGLFPPGEYHGTDAADHIAFAATQAELFTITPEMFTLVSGAAESMPPQHLEREDLPSMSGFLYLPAPLMLTDVNAAPIPVRAILWHEETLGNEGDPAMAPGIPPISRGIVVYTFIDTVDYLPAEERWMREHGKFLGRVVDPTLRARFIATTPKMGLINVMTIAFGAHTFTVDTERLRREFPDLTDVELARVARHVMRSQHDGEVFGDPDPETGAIQVRTMDGRVVWVRPEKMSQFLAAFFHFLQSDLSSIERGPLPRSLVKWLRRLGMPTDPITVVTFRRHKGASRGGGWELTYQYVRRGHWRRQPYGPRSSPTYRWIYIAPHLVGPADAPLRQRDVVNLLAR